MIHDDSASLLGIVPNNISIRDEIYLSEVPLTPFPVHRWYRFLFENENFEITLAVLVLLCALIWFIVPKVIKWLNND